jgi:hypothetical protein
MRARKLTIKRCSNGILTLLGAGAVLLSGCKDKPAPEPEGSGDAAEEPTAVTPVVTPALPVEGDEGSEPSPAGGEKVSNFDAAAEHLDLGGEIFIYQDVEGRAAKAAEFLREVMQMVPDDEPQVAALKELDWRGLFKDLGVMNVAAAGISSHQVDGRYLNKSYLHVPGGRRGVLRLFGRKAGEFETRKMAPADADLVIERELNLTEAYRVGRDLIKQFKEPQAERSWKQLMGQKVADLGVTVGDVFQKLDTRVIFIARLSDTETVAIPDAPIEVPKFDVYLSLDGMAWLFDKMLEKLPPEAAGAIEIGEGFKTLQLPPVPPEAPIMSPLLRVDTESGRVSIATSAAFMAECGSGKGGLFESAAFVATTAGLPTEGNGLTYVSEDVGKHVEKLLREGIGSTGEVPAQVVDRGLGIVAKILPQLRSGYARVSANLPDGILSVANSPSSWKQTALVVPLGVAGLGAVSFATLRKTEMRAQEIEAMRAQENAELKAALDAAEAQPE